MAEDIIKCVVWDLDNTLWKGTLLEDGHVTLSPATESVIRTLDERGILQSVASKNNYDDAMDQLKQFGLEEYFLYPQIHWNSKVDSIENIARSINIGIDTIAFVDDTPAELDEVAYSLPEVLCIPANEVLGIPDMPCMIPRFNTIDQKQRRQMYLSGIQRDRAEEAFKGPKESFLASLDMVLDIFPAKEVDLQRAEELTVRTNQLNATGYTYSYDELDRFRNSEDHILLMAGLTDKYGTYGHIGLTLLECSVTVWTIKLLLMSCRVMSRGVGSILLSHLINQAIENNVSLHAEFIPNDRNRMMNVTYRFAGFEEIDKRDSVEILKHPLNQTIEFPDYMQVNITY